jgi:hypothetical protein
MKCTLMLLTLLAFMGCSDTPSSQNVDGTMLDASAPDGAAMSDTLLPGDTSTVGDSLSSLDSQGAVDTASSDTGTGDAEPVADTTPLPCLCPKPQHCTDAGECADDVCAEGTTTCADLVSQKMCNDDGSAFSLSPCPESEACYLGECVATVCSPDDLPTCEDGDVKSCNSLGTAYILTPCPGGKGCQGGACVAIEPNVILIMDTSGSMNWINDQGIMPDECEGADCPPWSWPAACDDPEEPVTRLGKAKKALQSVVTSEAAKGLRMALQRFPQNQSLLLGAKGPTCGDGGLLGLNTWTADEHQTHELLADKVLGKSLRTVMPVPFASDGTSNVDELLSWIDFEETFETSEKSCNLLPLGCPGEVGDVKACLDGFCAIQTQPELRATGQTPIGRSLFYAGEILRHRVVVQGRACEADVDCDSPHYACVEGACHDAFRKCRPNVIVVFTDGGESVDTWAEIKESSAAFFNPRVQAKRLHYGLGCAGDSDCLNGATCVSDVCTSPELTVADKACHLTDVPCDSNAACSDYKYKCGPAQTCSGECEETGLTFIDTKAGQEVLRDSAGEPIAATVHVVDASKSMTSNSLIAAMGGGQHVSVELENIENLVDAFLPLLDVKVSLGGCQ